MHAAARSLRQRRVRAEVVCVRAPTDDGLCFEQRDLKTSVSGFSRISGARRRRLHPKTTARDSVTCDSL